MDRHVGGVRWDCVGWVFVCTPAYLYFTDQGQCFCLVEQKLHPVLLFVSYQPVPLPAD